MGGHEGQAQSNGFLPNGLLPSEAAYVTRVLDPERWSRAEERIVELISCIQPNQPSEERRNSVACYVQQLIMKCFSCQVFAFGSVPLKTYLPDGDIDLTAFTSNQNLKDTWASKVRDMLESEKKSDEAEFHVNEVQYIQSEVKIVKCLVENIVVDISFDQLGGLCTLCFLEKVDHLINQNHLFKHSIILIKAWCYYESRILGAHHGLISTYTLETLVMYIFHVFNNSFAGPLEVLYRFLEFFSRFDWDNFCISLWGPVPICSLPGMTADPPRKDGRELLSSKIFIDACCSVYADFSGGQKNQEQPFISKYLNVIDPLRTSNNLGRSVSKGNFFRIRSAFGFGAQRLARLLDCPKGNLIAEVDQFFMNTWRRHGKGHRTDAPDPLYGFRPLDLNNLDDSDSLSNYSSDNKAKENGSSHASKVEATRASCAPNTASFQHGNHSLRQSFRTSNLSSSSHPQNQKTYAHLANSMASVQNNHSAQNSRPNYLGNEVHATYPSVGRHNRVSASMIPANVPMINSPRSSSMHYSQGLVSFPVPQYPHNVGMACHREEVVVLVDDDFASRGMLEGDSGYGLSLKGETNSRRVFDSNNGAIIKENRELIPETHGDNFQYHSIRGTDVSSQSTSSKSKLSSEGSQNQSPTKVLKSKMERRGRKTVPSTDPSSVYGLHKHGQIFEGASVDHHYFQGTDGVWIALPTVGTKATDITIPLSAPAFVQTHQIPNYERTEMNGSNPELPIAPLIVGSGSRKSGINDHGVLPFAFYPSGPPLPFVTMLPLYKFPNEGGISGASTIYSDREEEHNNWHVGQFDQNFHSAENVD